MHQKKYDEIHWQNSTAFTLPKTNQSHLKMMKMDGWKTIVSFWGKRPIFQDLLLLVSGRVIKEMKVLKRWDDVFLMFSKLQNNFIHLFHIFHMFISLYIHILYIYIFHIFSHLLIWKCFSKPGSASTNQTLTSRWTSGYPKPTRLGVWLAPICLQLSLDRCRRKQQKIVKR